MTQSGTAFSKTTQKITKLIRTKHNRVEFSRMAPIRTTFSKMALRRTSESTEWHYRMTPSKDIFSRIDCELLFTCNSASVLLCCHITIRHSDECRSAEWYSTEYQYAYLCFAECHSADCHSARCCCTVYHSAEECQSAECHSVECCGIHLWTVSILFKIFYCRNIRRFQSVSSS